MANLFKAFLFKLRRDLTFKITLIIGATVAVFMTLIYFLIGRVMDMRLLTGEMMLLISLSPAQNFGIAIPVNLITFTILEFSQGSIRNKIIAGHSKGKIYISLCINGLVFAFSLITVYTLLCFSLGSIFGGFNIEGTSSYMMTMVSSYIPRMLVIAVFTYLSITMFTIFISTLTRSIGPSIPIVIITIVFSYLASTIISSLPNNDSLIWVLRIIDPLYGLSAIEYQQITSNAAKQCMTNETFISGILSNLVYATGFFFAGFFIFKKRDIK